MAMDKKILPDILPEDFFVLRSPLLPAAELEAWGKDAKAASFAGAQSDDAKRKEAWDEDVACLRARLRDLIARPEVAHSLFVASPSLESGLEYWKRDPGSKKGLQAERALVRYFQRMAARSTPFGLFSGCSVGRVATDGSASGSVLRIASRDGCRPCSRLDFDYLFALTDRLRRDKALAQEVRYWSNSSLHAFGDAWHYTECRVRGAARSHHLVKIESEPYLDAVLARAEQGAEIADLVQAVLAVPEGSDLQEDEIREFIQELIDNNVLVSNISPAVTGNSALDDLIAQLERAPSQNENTALLKCARERMAVLDSKGIGVSTVEYRSIAASLEKLPVEVDIARLFQVDMTRAVENAVLTKPVVDELMRAVEVVCHLSGSSESDQLRSFREAFSARYELARIPLLNALDEELGIGFGGLPGDSGPLVRGLQFGGERTGAERGKTEALLLRKLAGLEPSEGCELVLEWNELPQRGMASARLPDSFMVEATLIADSPEALRDGDFRLRWIGAPGPSSASFFGRFCHANPELERSVRKSLIEEEKHDPDAIYAEIVHLPEGRVGNVLCRPVLREHELVYLGRSGAAAKKQIPASDLLIGIEGGRIELYSRRLGKRVIPRMANAHGYMNPKLASVYRFLCYLQHQQGVAVPQFGWGNLESLDFLPRFRVGRIVLATARWRLRKEEIDDIAKPEGSDRFFRVQELRRKRRLPRWILFEESDHTLPVDLNNPLSVDAFVHVLKRGQQATLREMYPAPHQLCVASPEGRFFHELNVPFHRRPDVNDRPAEGDADRTARNRNRTEAVTSARAFGPTSEWLFLKLYGGRSTLDDILTTIVPGVVERAVASGGIDRWFFLRYADPHEHLRIRFNGHPETLRKEVFPLLSDIFDPLLHSRRIWKIQFDTYEREIERYGGLEGNLVAEDVFWADSEAVLRLLMQYRGDEGLQARWKLALLSIDALLSDFEFQPEAKLGLLKGWRDSAHREFKAGVTLKKQLGDRFRAERRTIQGLFDGSGAALPGIETAKRILATRSARLASAADRLRALEKSGKLGRTVPELLGSYVHMHVNRLVRGGGRQHELVLYDFLFRLYDGRRAREAKQAV